MKTQIPKNRRAISPVISALILSAAVLTVGAAVWAYSQGAMTINAEYYAESVINMTDTISERFIIEHVCYKDVYYEDVGYVTELHVFVYNYGTVDIEVRVEVNGVTYPVDEEVWLKLPSKEMELYQTIPLDPIWGEELNIKAYTRRENNVYYKYQVP